jgi:hypothetical protein
MFDDKFGLFGGERPPKILILKMLLDQIEAGLTQPHDIDLCRSDTTCRRWLRGK